ncbi:MAG: glycosyltransferase [Verrucomicrobia bacterium]|nr:glycosyltransferase [Verrucomicrobiota bacterium]MDA1087441.1 glycosyltransferase [Verrucomicrobiota bacterium]
MSSIHQFVAGFAKGDAISNAALDMRDIFRSWGIDSRIFSERQRILPELRKDAHDAAEFATAPDPEGIAILHLSIGSAVNDIFRRLPCRKVIVYHNITPSHFYRLIHGQTARMLEWGQKQRDELAGVADINLAVSRFNADELRGAGYDKVDVLPLPLNLDRLTGSPDRGVQRRYSDRSINILSVGRCAPNKRIEDSLLAFDCFQKTVEPHSRFFHVGSYAGTEPYYHLLLSLTLKLDLRDVHFTGSVPQPQLNAYYQVADILLCMSEHEGFCVPLVEGMVHQLPIVAYAAGAVPETLAGSGVLFHTRDHAAIAESMGRLAHDPDLRSAVVARQCARLKDYRALDLEKLLHEHLDPLLKASSTFAT